MESITQTTAGAALQTVGSRVDKQDATPTNVSKARRISLESFAWFTLAYNVASPQLVDDTLTDAARAGATIARAGAPTFWGGYSGVFVDPDGHPWEVAHNPDWPLDQEGRVHLP